MNFLPIFLKLSQQPCLVVGGGEVAARKVNILMRAGGHVTVVSPQIKGSLTELAEAGAIRFIHKPFEASDLDGFQLVVSATDRHAVNAAVAEAARARGLPVNVVDCPELCSFIFPSIVDRSPVVIAVSTGGTSPVLARLVRARLETLLPAAYGNLARLAEAFRQRVRQALPEGGQRRRFWEKALSGEVADLMFSGREDAATQRFTALLNQAAGHGEGRAAGFVSLVGAGPGDPDLLTLRALRAIQEADVIVHDRLASSEILNMARADVERIHAGKARSQHTLPQEDINALLVKLAREGKRVVRLKGGDPFIFGRGGEEIETLMTEGIAFQVVPGVTAASGCAAYAGIPLTHRDFAQSVTFVTGHTREGVLGDIDWARLARPGQTLVVYMGLHGLPQIRDALLAHGCPPGMPAAIVEHGTTPRQRVVTGDLGTLYEQAVKDEIESPALIIVGEVVRLHDKLAWFQRAATPAPENG